MGKNPRAWPSSLIAAPSMSHDNNSGDSNAQEVAFVLQKSSHCSFDIFTEKIILLLHKLYNNYSGLVKL